MLTPLDIVLIVFYCYILLVIVPVIIMENRTPIKSISWLLVLMFLPVLGLILYLIMGRDYRKKKIISQKSIQRIAMRPCSEIDIKSLDETNIDVNILKHVHLLNNNSEADAYTHNKIDVFAEGENIFDAIFEAIRCAKSHIHIEFFIFEDDKISNKLRELLIQKSREGVRVRMIYDYLGSYKLSKNYIRSLRTAGVHARPFLPLRLRFGRNKINYRNHRKLIVVDGKIGFTGGVNIADRYIYGSELGRWRDTVVRIEGPGVHGIQKLFLVDWYFVEKKLITHRKYFPEPNIFEGRNVMQIVSSGPDTDWQAIMQGISSAIMLAEKYVYIHTPYFMPNELVAGVIQMAAMSGVEVRLMIPERSDTRITDWSTSTYLGRILEAGVRVFKYQGGMLHSKAIVIDDKLSIVGSANIDERSFSQNFEVNAFIYDYNTSHQLKDLFIHDLTECREITLEEWNNRKRLQKYKESIARLFSPLL